MRVATMIILLGAAGLVAACGPGREETYRGPAEPAVGGSASTVAGAEAAAGMAAPSAETMVADATPAGGTAHFRCESGQLLTIRFDNAANKAFLSGGDSDERALDARPVASGMLYESPMESIRGQGDVIQYARGRMAPSECVRILEGQHRILTERRAAGIQWRALGQEPGWIVDVTADGGLEAQLDYGQRRITTPPANREGENGTTRWTAQTEAGSLDLTVTRGACNDTMSDDRFWFTATLVVDGQTLRGCAQPLAG